MNKQKVSDKELSSVKVPITNRELDEHFVKAAQEDEEIIMQKIMAAKKKLYKTFRTGKRYQIGDVGFDAYTFVFIEKQGIHHCFKEVDGGWTRTYTDAQLVGKKIVEV